MSLDLTHGSAMAYETILYGNMTPKMAAEYLREERISIRSFSDTLRQMYPNDDIQRRLKQFYREIPIDRKQRSMDRKIQNWISGRNQPTSREDYFRIAFALGLTETQLNFLLGMCTDYAIQYRDGQEVVLAWFLRNGYGYQEAMDFLKELPYPESGPGFSMVLFEKTVIPQGSGGNAGVTTKSAYTSGYASSAANSPARPEHGRFRGTSGLTAGSTAFYAKGYTEVSRITHEIRNEFQLVSTVDDLRLCYLRNLDRFGQMHLRSYYYFRQYLKQLIQPLSVAG